MCAYKILIIGFLAFGFQSKAQLISFAPEGGFTPQDNGWTNNAGMQYNPEARPSMVMNIPLPVATNPNDTVPSFSNIRSSVATYPVQNGQYLGIVYWPPGTNVPPPTVINFDVSGSPAPSIRWGIAEGNRLSGALPFDYSLTGPQGQTITPGGNWLAGAQVITNNTIGTYTLTFTHKPTFSADGTGTAFVIESSLGKVAMKISYRTTDVQPTTPPPTGPPPTGPPSTPVSRPTAIIGWSQWYRVKTGKPPLSVPLPLSNHTPYTKSNLFFPLRGRAGLRGNYRKYR